MNQIAIKSVRVQPLQHAFVVNVSQLVIFFSFLLIGLPLSGEIPEPPRLVRDIDAIAPGPSAVEFIVWGVVYASALFLVLKHTGSTKNARLVVHLLPMILYIASTLISPYSRAPVSDILQLVGSTAVALLAARSLAYNFDRTARTIHRATLLNLALNFSLIILLPNQTIGEDGRWSSLTGNANFLAAIALINLTFLMVNFISKGRGAFSFVVFAALPAVILIGTQSATSSGVAIATSALFILFLLKRIEIRSRKVIWVLVLILVVFAFAMSDALATLFLDAVGKDFTLSGRISIWQGGINALSGHFWYGYGAGVTTFDVGATNWPTHFHNGFLQLLIWFGALGLVLFLASFLLTLVNLKGIFERRAQFFVIAVLQCFVLYNLTEVSVFLWRNPVWLLYLVTVFFCEAKIGLRKR